MYIITIKTKTAGKVIKAEFKSLKQAWMYFYTFQSDGYTPQIKKV